MIFETHAAARAYAADQTASTRRIHKAVAAMAWIHDRATGDYTLEPRYTVVLRAA